MRQIIYMVAIGYFCLSHSVFGNPLPKELHIARQENYPPYIYEHNGNVIGVCAEIAEAAFRLLDIRVTYTEYPFVRMLKKAEWGQVAPCVRIVVASVRT